jgi:transcriptional pleiotropic regulator of transition state genes
LEFTKKINKAGSLTLPAAMRRELGIDRGERFKIISKNEGSIELKRIQGECIFCKADGDLLVHAGRFVCENCLQQMNRINQERSRQL